MRTVRYSKQADGVLAKLSVAQASLIENKVDQLAFDPESLASNIKRLRGSPLLRLRVGDYRVIYTEDLIILDIITIGHRKDVYE
jgi:mRNA interferase RelE/StbE